MSFKSLLLHGTLWSDEVEKEEPFLTLTRLECEQLIRNVAPSLVFNHYSDDEDSNIIIKRYMKFLTEVRRFGEIK
jgi:hypothetical protein